MNLFGGVWLADRLQDRPYLPIKEQNTAIGGGGFRDRVRKQCPGCMSEHKKNMPYTGSDWQNKAILDLTDLNLVTKRENSGAGFFKIGYISVFKAKYLISRV